MDPEHIDITPTHEQTTWQFLRMYDALNPDGRKAANTQLLETARLADHANECRQAIAAITNALGRPDVNNIPAVLFDAIREAGDLLAFKLNKD